MTSLSSGGKCNIVYILDFLPTYVARELKALQNLGLATEVHLPESSAASALWDRVLGSSPEKSDALRRDIPMGWCTAPAGRFLPKALLFLLAVGAGRPIRTTSLTLKALRQGTFRYLLAAAATTYFLRGRHPSLIHAHFAKDAGWIAAYTAGLLGVPFTLTTHAIDIFAPADPKRVRALLWKASAVHTISTFNRNYMEERYGPGLRGRVKVARLGLDPNTLPSHCPSAEELLIVCTASGLVPKKGVDVLLEACSILRQRGFEFRAEIIGSDPDGTRLKEFRRSVQEAGLEEIVNLRGLLSADDALEVVSGATIFALPSILAPNGDMDGIPVALMEAMGMGIPSVSTRLSGIPELVEDGHTGLLAEPGNPVSLADALGRLLCDPDLAAQLGAAGRERVLREFTVDRYASDLVSLWTDLCSNRGD